MGSELKLYRQVADKIKNLIVQETLKDGDKVPSIRGLSRDLGVSINTVKEAYLYLENNQYIISKPQSGFYVNNQNTNFDNNNILAPVLLNPLKENICRIYSSQIVNGSCPPEAELAVSSISTDLRPKQKLANCYQNVFKYHGDEALNYCLPPGYLPLREQIAVQLVRARMKVNPDEIIITSGCTNSVALALMAICKPDDTIAIESPMYFNFLKICEELKLNVIEIPNSRESGLSLDTLEFVLEYHNIKAFLCTPNCNNPLGSIMSDKQKHELVKCMERFNVPLIEDDVYGELYYIENRPTTCKSFDKTGNVIHCSSFTKNIAPGLRVGWVIPGKYYKQIENKEFLFTLGNSGISQIALSYYLKEGGYERHNRQLRSKLKLQLQEMMDYILEIFPKETKITMPQGGIVLWVECPEYINILDVYKKVIEKGVFFAPGPIFTLSGKYTNFLRLNGGIWNDDIKKAIVEISNCLSTGFLPG